MPLSSHHTTQKHYFYSLLYHEPPGLFGCRPRLPASISRTTLGYTGRTTATLLMLIGISNCCSRFITGLAINTSDIDPILVQFGSNGIVGMVFLFMPLLVQTFGGQATFAVMFGFYANYYVALLGPITVS